MPLREEGAQRVYFLGTANHVTCKPIRKSRDRKRAGLEKGKGPATAEGRNGHERGGASHHVTRAIVSIGLLCATSITVE